MQDYNHLCEQYILRTPVRLVLLQKAMLTIRDESVISGPTISSPSSAAWFYLSVEFLVGLGISGFLLFLSLVKSVLPKPPRDLTGDVVLVCIFQKRYTYTLKKVLSVMELTLRYSKNFVYWLVCIIKTSI